MEKLFSCDLTVLKIDNGWILALDYWNHSRHVSKLAPFCFRFLSPALGPSLATGKLLFICSRSNILIRFFQYTWALHPINRSLNRLAILPIAQPAYYPIISQK
jgi:hypothetical protein